MELVHNRRMPLQIPVKQRSHRELRVVHIAIVVVKYVLTPIRRAANAVLLGLLVDLVPVVPVHITVAAVGLSNRRYGDDYVVSNLVYDWRVLGGESISELH